MTTETIAVRVSRTADQVREEAARLDPAKAALTAVMIVPFLLGWLAGALWLAIAWTWTAALVGWRTAQHRTGAPARAGRERPGD